MLSRFGRSVMTCMLTVGSLADYANGELRTWSDSSGKHTVDAELVEIIDGVVKLKGIDGRSIKVPLERLSKSDRDWLKAESVRSRPQGVASSEMKRLSGHQFPIGCVRWSPDGSTVASCAGGSALAVEEAREKYVVMLWDTSSWRAVGRLAGHTGPVQSVVWLTDSRRVVTGSADGTVRVWDTRTSSEIMQLEEHNGMVTAMSVSGRKPRLLTTSIDGMIRLFDLDSGELVGLFETSDDEGDQERASLTCVAWSQDGRRFACGDMEGRLFVWSVDAPKNRDVIAVSDGAVLSVDWSPDGTSMVFGDTEGKIELLSTDDYQVVRSFAGHSEAVATVAFGPKGDRIASGGGSVFLSRLVDDAMMTTEVTFAAKMAMHKGTTSLTTIDSKTRKSQTELLFGIFEFVGLRKAVSKNGKDLDIRVWSAADGREVASLAGHKQRVNSVAWSADGNQIASGSNDGLVGIWNIQSEPLASPNVAERYRLKDGDRIGEGAVVNIDDVGNWNVQLPTPQIKIGSLTFSTPCKLTVLVSDKSLLAEQAGVTVGDESGKIWKSSAVNLDGKDVFGFFQE